MGRLRVSVRSDGLAAEIQASPGPPVTAAELHAELAKARIVHGIDASAIEELAKRLADPNGKGNQIVASGAAPVHGTDGSLSFSFAAAPIAGTTHRDGRIDFSERELLHPAAVGQEIARIVLPTAGTPGRTVRGESIASKPGRPFSQRPGPGVAVQGDRVVALRPGVVLHSPRQIDVVSLHTHQSNVDVDSGNLHSHGSLAIRGDVCEGFGVQAGGDVQITGAVLDAVVTAGGSVHVAQGILGTNTQVQADGDITCHHATSALLAAGRMIDLGDEATWCRMRAEHIRILGGRGVAFGGDLRARQAIDLRVAGTANGALTRLSVCALDDERTELVRRQAEAARLDRSAQRAGHTDAKATREATRAADHSQEERLRVLQRQRELLRTASIRIADTVHPGVVLQFGQTTMTITETLPPSSFHFDPEHDTIVRGPIP